MLTLLRRARGVGLDIGSGSVKALVLERRRSEVVVVGCGVAPIGAGEDLLELRQAVHAALADAGASGEPVIASVGGPDVVIRVISLPPVPKPKVLPALELQHRELGLLPPREAILDAHILRKSRKDVTSNEILAVSLPKPRLDERVRLLRQAAVEVRILDVEPLALLNGGIHLTALESGELLVLLTVGQETSTLCLFSEQGPVVARYLNVGAGAFSERLRTIFPGQERSKPWTIPAAEVPKAESACQDIVDQMAEDIRLSLTFYRTEYDRESLPRYAIGGSVDLPYIGRWIAGRLGLGAPLEVLDPFKATEVKMARTTVDLAASGPIFLQAFGLALRGV
ncbi:MAG TPA: pilus assembly protein PilM [Candidatus Methylomirabilis sp.]|nr:pilus assembly protein PilM [Candidatus Methylomirabilis sp.]